MGEIELYPLLMESVPKETVWGGSRLKTDYGKSAGTDRLGESWELSAVPGSESRVLNGCYRGMTLNALAETYGTAFWGAHGKGRRFPLLVKLIDAAQNLSVQVHPSDERADAAKGEQGKAEMWYVLDAKPESCLYLGFSGRVSRETLEKSCERGTVLSLLNRVRVSKGDVFYVPPGTIHAIGRGITLAEIQQSSDTTFRIYDYDRLDADGRPRALHWEQGCRVVDYEPLVPERCRANAMVQFDAFTLSELYSCAYFRAYRIDVRKSVRLSCDAASFRNVLCVEGSGTINCRGEDYPIGKGQSYFLPAGMGDYRLAGNCTVLLSWI